MNSMFLGLALAYVLGVITGPWWGGAWRLLTRRGRRRGFEDYFPDDAPTKRKRRSGR
jgi:hypothetical protein